MSDDYAMAVRDAVISFAQNAEDVRLLRVLDEVENGFFVDVGAASPTVGSVTELFVRRGWTGINIEPGPRYAELVAARRGDVNLEVVVGAVPGEAEFHLTYPDLGMSTRDLSAHAMAASAIERTETVMRPVMRLADILATHGPPADIHFLKIDVEGSEADVIASNDWSRFRPWVVVVEAVRTWSRESNHGSWEHLLLDAGFVFAAFDGINRFYVPVEREALVEPLRYPMSVLDRFVTADYHDALVALSELERVAAETLVERRRTIGDAMVGLENELIRLQRALIAAEDRFEEARFQREAAEALAALRENEITAMTQTRAWKAASALRSVRAPVRRLMTGPSKGVARQERLVDREEGAAPGQTTGNGGGDDGDLDGRAVSKG